MVRRRPVKRDNGWTKHLATGGKIIGLDYEVMAKKVSWSKTTLSNLVSCQFQFDHCFIEINGVGEFWQSDDLEVIRSDGITVDPFYMVRRLQKKIIGGSLGDRWLVIRQDTPHNLKLTFMSGAPMYTMENMKVISVRDLDGKWLTAEIDAQKLTTRYYFSERRI